MRSNLSLIRPRALSLIEVMVTLVIFSVMAAFMFAAVQTIISQWKAAEQRRSLYEKAGVLVDMMADDIRLAATREPPGTEEVKVKFIGDYDPDSPLAHRQRLMFVRSFEAGPERALTSNAGDGRANPTTLNSNPDDDPPLAANIDADYFDGKKIGDFKALGGMAMIGYFVKNQTLYRAIRSPVDGPMSALCTPRRRAAAGDGRAVSGLRLLEPEYGRLERAQGSRRTRISGRRTSGIRRAASASRRSTNSSCIAASSRSTIPRTMSFRARFASR